MMEMRGTERFMTEFPFHIKEFEFIQFSVLMIVGGDLLSNQMETNSLEFHWKHKPQCCLS